MSLARLSVTTGAVVSRVKVSEEVPVLPAVSVSLATMVWDAVGQAGRREAPHPAGIGGRRAERRRTFLERHHRVRITRPGERVVRGILSLAEKPVSLARLVTGAVVSILAST